MNEKIKIYIEKLTSYWQSTSNNQRIKIGASIAFVLIAFIILFTWALTPEYTSIVSKLPDNEAGEIIKELEKLGVSYKLEGDSILVPKAQAIKARLDLAASGYPKSGSIDYGIFTDTGFGMTKDQFSVLKKGALEGELEKTIENIIVVDDARVHLNVPEPSVWVRENQNEASAAVYLNLKPGVTLDDKQILGIEQLITMSVPGIDRERVILIDQNGRRLAASSSDNDNSLSYVFTNQMEIKAGIESQIQKNLRNSLESIMGVGNVVVDAIAKVNFDQKNKLENLVSPVVGDQGIIISSQEENESSTSNVREGGVPGVTGNDPSTYEAADSQSGNYERSNSIINREVNRTQIETKVQPFQVEDVSISILLNQREDKPVAEEMLQSITNIAKNIVLTTATHNILPEDVKVSVLAYEFDTTIADQLSKKSLSTMDILYIVGAVIGVIAVAGGAFVVSRRKKAQDIVEEIIPQSISTDYDIEVDEEGQQVKKQLERLAKQKPEDFTKLLRTWLMED